MQDNNEGWYFVNDADTMKTYIAPDDPVVEKLFGKPKKPQLTEEQKKRRKELHELGAARSKNLQQRNALQSQKEPQAFYENYEFLNDSCPVISDFVKMLGYDPKIVRKLTVEIEENKEVIVHADTYALANGTPDIGAVWRADFLENDIKVNN